MYNKLSQLAHHFWVISQCFTPRGRKPVLRGKSQAPKIQVLEVRRRSKQDLAIQQVKANRSNKESLTILAAKLDIDMFRRNAPHSSAIISYLGS